MRAATFHEKTIIVDGTPRPTTNSRDGFIALTEAGLISFWRWFGDSKAIDDYGRPLVLFHGTTADIKEFDPSKADDKLYVGGTFNTVFFTDNPENASSYAGRRTSMTGLSETFSEGASLYPVYLRILNPLKTNAKNNNWKDVLYKGELHSTAELSSIAQEMKKDGLIVRKVVDHRDCGVNSELTAKPSTTFAVFNPSQIKSSIGNSGHYCLSSADFTDRSITPTEYKISKKLAPQLVFDFYDDPEEEEIYKLAQLASTAASKTRSRKISRP